MNAMGVKDILAFLIALLHEDPEAARCLLDFSRCFVGRCIEREAAQKEHRKACLEPIELRMPTLADMGVNVVGCSACRLTPKNCKCPGCGNSGVAPLARKRRRVRS
jgi:hypothetical protein